MVGTAVALLLIFAVLSDARLLSLSGAIGAYVGLGCSRSYTASAASTASIASAACTACTAIGVGVAHSTLLD